MSYHLDYYYKKKQEYIDQLGGKCVLCNSTENLNFDHIDQNTKKFPISKLMNYSKEVIQTELKKCQLLCVDCHRAKTLKNKENLKNKAKGEKTNCNVITTEEVIALKSRRKEGLTLNQLMLEFPYKKATIYAIISGKTWKHISV